MDWFKERTQIKGASDWYKVTTTIIKYIHSFRPSIERRLLCHGCLVDHSRESCGKRRKISCSSLVGLERSFRLTIAILMNGWLPWKFEIVSHQSFGKAHNIKRHFFELARQVLGADKLSDWYKGVTF